MDRFVTFVLAAWPLLLISATIFLGKHFLPAWIQRRAEFGFDKKMEEVRGEIGKSETRLRAALDAKQKELDSLREVTLSNANNRVAALETRRLQAAEAVWNEVVDLMKLRAAAETAGSLKLSKIAERVNADPKMKQFMDTVTGSLSIDKLPGSGAAKHRPFITESVWASYSAYSSVLHLGAVRLKMAQMGITDADQMLKTEVSNKIIFTALPHREDFIRQQGPAGYHLLIEELEGLILNDIKDMLDGKDTDAATIKRNKELLKAVNEVQTGTQTALSDAISSQ